MVNSDLDIKAPTNTNARIWRYLDLTKFMSMLDQKALFFSNIQDLFDPYEATLPLIDKAKVTRDFTKAANRIKADIPYPRTEIIERSIKRYEDLAKKNRKFFLVNCWHMSEIESAFMWDVYSSRSKGIAIQSTYNMLTEALKIDTVYKPEVGIVEYRDFERDENKESNLKNLAFTKRSSFQYERELRAVITLPYDEVKTNGRNVNVDLTKLLEKIYLAPLSEPWQEHLIKSILSKYDMDEGLVKVSDLYTLK